MKKIPGKGILIALVLLGVLLLFNRRQVQLTAQDSLQLYSLGGNGYGLKSVIHLNNPNLLSSTINNINQKFYVDGVYAGELKINLEQGIPGRKITDLPVEIRLTADEGTALYTAIKTGNKHKVNITGEINFHNLTGSGKIAVDIQEAPLQTQ